MTKLTVNYKNNRITDKKSLFHNQFHSVNNVNTLNRVSNLASGKVIGHTLADERSPNTSVNNITFTAESLPPLMHVGYTISDKYDILFIQWQNLEHIISVTTERIGRKQAIGSK